MELKELSGFGIDAISTNQNFNNIMFELSWSGEKKSEVKIIIEGIIQMNLSRDLDDINGSAYVGAVIIESVSGDKSECMEKLGHRITEPNTGKPPKYMSSTLYKLNLDGDVCIDVVCQKITVKSEFKTFFDSQRK